MSKCKTFTYYRLEKERIEYYGDELKEGEVYYESDEDDSYEEITNEMLEEELGKRQKVESHRSNEDLKNRVENTNKGQNIPFDGPCSFENTPSSSYDTSQNYEKLDKCTLKNNENTDIKKSRKVSFADLNLQHNIDHDMDETLMKSKKRSSKKQINNNSPESDDSDDDIIRIEFEHSTEKPHHSESTNDTIESPRDIYRIFNRRKSILKKSSHEILVSPSSTTHLEYTTDDETEDEPDKPSAYKSVSIIIITDISILSSTWHQE